MFNPLKALDAYICKRKAKHLEQYVEEVLPKRAAHWKAVLGEDTKIYYWFSSEKGSATVTVDMPSCTLQWEVSSVSGMEMYIRRMEKALKEVFGDSRIQG